MNLKTRDMTLIAVMAALICVAGPLSVRALEKLVDRMIEGQKKKPRMKISDERLYFIGVGF